MTLRSQGRSVLVSLLVLALWALGVPVPASAQPSTATEYEVKAAFIYNFIRFVEWPAARFDSADAPYVVCIVGDNPFGPVLENVLADRTAGGRPIGTRTFDIFDSRASACHVIFVGAPDEEVGDAAAAHSHPGVLIVGEGLTFTDAGGIIALTVADRRVRFAINLKRAEMAGLKISSQLLKLANVVDESAARGTTDDEAR